ncbi:hypothetical protein QJS10_CPA07g01316 [Acorus calamus]|uniref:Uncharacterized protein n=1 Tax=Acorus calamus TaxID=4465 RepID=A0AAV9EH73_ACOCL|nr:hypothetical protein QJS10_CPA07g01316 [Acorus calamus]
MGAPHGEVGLNSSFTMMEGMWDAGQQLSNTARGGPNHPAAGAVILATSWVVWRTHNGVIFQGHRAYVENVWAEIDGLFRYWS